MPFHRGWRPSQSMRRPEKKKTLKRIRILEIEDSKVVSDQLKPPLGGDQEGRQENVRIISHFIFWCRCTWRSTLCPRLYRWDKPPHRGDNDKKRTIMSWRPHKVQVEKSTLLGSALFCGKIWAKYQVVRIMSDVQTMSWQPPDNDQSFLRQDLKVTGWPVHRNGNEWRRRRACYGWNLIRSLPLPASSIPPSPSRLGDPPPSVSSDKSSPFIFKSTCLPEGF